MTLDQRKVDFLPSRVPQAERVAVARTAAFGRRLLERDVQQTAPSSEPLDRAIERLPAPFGTVRSLLQREIILRD